MIDLPTLLRQALAECARQSSDPPRGGAFGQTLRRISPTFNPHDYGFATLGLLLKAHEDVVVTEHDGVDIVVRPATGTAIEAAAATPSPEFQLVRPDIWRAFTHYAPQTFRRPSG